MFWILREIFNKIKAILIKTLLFQTAGLIIKRDVFKAAYDFKINPHKRTPEEEDTTKVGFRHLELSFQFYILIWSLILIPSLFFEMFLAKLMEQILKKLRKWLRKTGLRAKQKYVSLPDRFHKTTIIKN